ncbi:uncharacterized protein LOC141632837 [Silene latifolia]|uniref:uncharacterized protein LOC141632837 n=1 Tax=Silene latifolia TaxID=37657 RepID=UPI003D785A17
MLTYKTKNFQGAQFFYPCCWLVGKLDQDLCPETGIHLVTYQQPTPVGDWATSLTYSGILPSHRIISFMAVQGQLATVINLQRRGFSLANKCCLCETHEENHAHLFFSCPYSPHVWSSILQWMNVVRPVLTFQQELSLLDTSYMTRWRKHWFQVSIAAVVHSLWTERNHRLFA